MKLLRGLFIVLLLYAVDAQALNRFQISSLPNDVREDALQRFPDLDSPGVQQDTLDDLIRYLAQTGRYQKIFLRAVTSGSDTSYNLEIRPNREIKSFSLSGNETFSDDELLNQLSLAEGEYFQPQDVAFAKEALLEVYKSKAFLEPEIDIRTEEIGPTSLRLIIAIEEGPRSKISSTIIRSDNNTLNEELERLVRSFKGEAITDPNLAELREVLIEHLRTEGYYQATLQGPRITRVNKDGAQLIYSLNHPIRFNIALKGNLNLSTSQLIDSLELNTFFSPNPAITDELESRLEQYYLERGYAHIDIKGRIEERSPNFVRALVFDINEGPLVQIKDFEVRGSISRPSSYYTDILREESTDLIRRNLYNRQDIEGALGALTIRLQNEGFLQAKVITFRAEYTDDKSKVNLSLNLNEGPLTHVQEIVFEDNDNIPVRELKDLLELSGGEPLRLNLLEEGIERIKNHYREQGFLEAKIKNEKKSIVRYNADQTLARIVFEIEEGPKVTVADIILEGNDFTKDYVILFELEFEKGDILTPEKLRESLRRLQRVGYFSTVDIRMPEADTAIANRTVLVTVTERAPGLLNFGLGITNERELTLRGYTGVAYRNLYGTGRALTTRLDGKYNVTFLKYPEYQISAGYFEPYLFDSRLSGRVNLIRREEIDSFASNSKKELSQIQARRTDEVVFSLEKNVTSNILVRWNVWDFSSSQRLTLESEKNFSTRTNIASFGPYIDLDFRDHPFNPSSGSRWLFNAEYAHPILGSTETIEFSRATASYTKYWNVYSNLVWANSFSSGFLKNMSDRDDGGVPYDLQGFFLGGVNTLRGFDYKNERFPQASELTGDSEANEYLLTDESSYYLIKSEIRFPIYGIVAGAFFVDGGQVVVTDPGSLYDNSFRASLGLALRIVTPVGAINFEWGVKAKPRAERGESPSHLHFSIGTF